ncbi:hypothetical protein C1H46_023243 [Malus baccata]|uniref:Uncharacterized protein n=1 Tax=Malus baccata TaxID=106549 RepID=A0A540LXD4_MALBA|nr:hypothetical protein C1H46_023243 [Malus baccata]
MHDLQQTRLFRLHPTVLHIIVIIHRFVTVFFLLTFQYDLVFRLLTGRRQRQRRLNYHSLPSRVCFQTLMFRRRPQALPLHVRLVPDRGGQVGTRRRGRQLGALASPPQSGVPVIFDGIVGAAGEEAGDGGPLITVEGMSLDNNGVLLRRKGLVLDGGAELIAPTEAAGLAGAAGNASADEGPVTGAVLGHQFDQGGVLLRAP